jgi:hypothetical protein
MQTRVIEYPELAETSEYFGAFWPPYPCGFHDGLNGVCAWDKWQGPRLSAYLLGVQDGQVAVKAARTI